MALRDESALRWSSILVLVAIAAALVTAIALAATTMIP